MYRQEVVAVGISRIESVVTFRCPEVAFLGLVADRSNPKCDIEGFEGNIVSNEI